MKKNIILAFSVLSIFSIAQAKQFKDVTMPDEINIQDKKLMLNGMGLREVTKFGFKIKVYVAGLYTEKKNSDSDALIKSEETKKIVMQFVRSVDREDLLKAFQAGYSDNCVVSCDSKSDQFKPFGESVVSVRKDNKIQMTFFSDRVELEIDGPNAKKKTFADKNLSHNLLAIFINAKTPPTHDLRKGLLGL